MAEDHLLLPSPLVGHAGDMLPVQRRALSVLNQFDERVADHLLGLQAKAVVQGPVGVEDVPIGVRDDDGVLGAVHQVGVQADFLQVLGDLPFQAAAFLFQPTGLGHHLLVQLGPVGGGAQLFGQHRVEDAAQIVAQPVIVPVRIPFGHGGVKDQQDRMLVGFHRGRAGRGTDQAHFPH